MSLPEAGQEQHTRSAADSPLKAILTLGAVQALTMGAGLARTKVLALLLGPDGLGIAGVIDQTVALVSHAGSLSIPFAALTFMSRRRSEGSEPFTQLYLAFFKALLLASVAATVISVAIAVWHTELIADELVSYRLALVAGIVSAPALAATAFLRSVLAAIERHRQAAFVALLGGIALVVTSYAGVRLGGLAGLYTGNLIVAAATVLLVTRYLRKSGEVTTISHTASITELRSVEGLQQFVVVLHTLSLVSPVAYLLARVAVLEHHGAAATGLLHAGYGLAVAVRVVLGQANMLYFTPLVNRPTSTAARAQAAAEYLRVLVVLLFAGALAIVLFPREWVMLLYSRQFVGASSIVAAFMVGEAILLLAGVYQMLLVAYGDVKAHALIAAVGQLLLLALALRLVPAMGPPGVAIAFIAGHLLILVLLLVRLRHRHKVPDILRPLPLMLAGLGGVAAAGWWAIAAMPTAGWKLLLFLVAAGGMTLLLSAEERRWLLAPLRARISR